MSDELFVPESFAYLTGSEPESSGWPRSAAPTSVPVLAYRPANPAISANSASPGPAVPLADENSNPSHAVTPEDPPNGSFCAHTTTLRQKFLIGAYSARLRDQPQGPDGVTACAKGLCPRGTHIITPVTCGDVNQARSGEE